jgi:tellurite resistance protein TerC
VHTIRCLAPVEAVVMIDEGAVVSLHSRPLRREPLSRAPCQNVGVIANCRFAAERQPMPVHFISWVGFLVLILGFLAVDLGIFHRKAHKVQFKEALAWSAVWIVLALLFCLGVFWFKGSQAGVEWLTGYLIEKTLAVDNIIICLLIFSTFATPPENQYRVLFWGVVVAIVSRGVLIAFAGLLLATFHWITYVFSAFLIVTGIGLLRGGHAAPTLERNALVRVAKRFFPVTESYEGQHFFVVCNGVRHMTPLFLVLLLVETVDVVLAVDSIPAIFGVTKDPFIVYTSNVMAMLGLRSLYFVFADRLPRPGQVRTYLAAIPTFVGLKLLVSDVFEIPALVSLGFVVVILTVALVASVVTHRGSDVDRHDPEMANPRAKAGAKVLF